MATIRFYKYELIGDTEWVYRYTIPNLETLNIQYNTPISPMPLPEEDADENILVKIEGNSASIDIDWTLANYEYTNGNSHFQQWDSQGTEKLEVDNTNVRGKFDPIPLTFRDMLEPSGNPSKQIQIFKDKFESKSLNNDFLITIEDGDANSYGTAADPMRFYGSVSQMSFSISGSSPIVWRARIQFFVGNVITVFDPDSPESPQDLSMTAIANYGANSDRDVFKVRFKDPTSFGATDTHTAYISYRRAGKLKWYTAEYGIETGQGTNGTNKKLTKINDSGTDHGYYVVYLPLAPHEEAPITYHTAEDPDCTHGEEDPTGKFGKHLFLTSTGLFDTTAYATASANTFKMEGSTTSNPEFYDVKVYFENSAGDGGTAEESAKTVTD